MNLVNLIDFLQSLFKQDRISGFSNNLFLMCVVTLNFKWSEIVAVYSHL